MTDSIKSLIQEIKKVYISKINEIENTENIPKSILNKLAKLGSFSIQLEEKNIKYTDLFLYHKLLGEIHSSLQNIIAVNSMVYETLNKLPQTNQIKKHKKNILSLKYIYSFAITEENIGSDALGVELNAKRVEEGYILNGNKKWITLGEIADFFLVLTKLKEGYFIFLIDRKTPGVTVDPIKNIMGMKGNMLAKITFQDCFVESNFKLCESTIKSINAIFSGLMMGRYLTAVGALGIMSSSLKTSLKYSKDRKQGEEFIANYQLIQKKITEMIILYKTSELLCKKTAESLEQNKNKELVLLAKLYTTTSANKLCNIAFEIFAANGLLEENGIARNLRDSKLFCLIEGTTEVHEILISKAAIGGKFCDEEEIL